MNSTIAATPRRPTLADPGEYIFKEFCRILVGWPLYAATGRLERPSFADGGGIERRAIATEGPFCEAVAVYADLYFCWLRLRAAGGDLMAGIVLDYWQDQRTYEQIGDARRIGNDTITANLWEGTKKLAEYYTRLPDARQRVNDWREERRGKARDFV